MKQLFLSRNTLNELSTILESKSLSTMGEIRQLDKILSKKIEPLILPYQEAVKKIKEETKISINKDLLNAGIHQEKGDLEINKLVDTIGIEQIKVQLEDADFIFIKGLWSTTNQLNTTRRAREILINIDDAFENAETIEDSPKEVAKKNDGENGENETKNPEQSAEPIKPLSN